MRCGRPKEVHRLVSRQYWDVPSSETMATTKTHMTHSVFRFCNVCCHILHRFLVMPHVTERLAHKGIVPVKIIQGQGNPGHSNRLRSLFVPALCGSERPVCPSAPLGVAARNNILESIAEHKVRGLRTLEPPINLSRV